MIRNYLKIAYRNLLKYKFISFINLFGLTVGLSCCLLILTYILNEISFDRFNDKPGEVYRVTRSFHNDQGVVNLHLGTIAPPFGPMLKNEFPQIKKITVLLANGVTAFRYEDKMFNEDKVFFADENLFDVFKIKVTKGNQSKALIEPYNVMLTEEIAKKYFGNDEPLNKMIRLDNNLNCKVTGVFKPLPSNSHIHPTILISFNTLRDTAVYGEENLRTNWGNNSFFTYVRLPENYNAKNLEALFPAFLDKYFHFPGEPPNFKASRTTHLYLQKLTDIHLRSHLDYEAEENGDINRVYIFSAIALFILLIACINYMNLSTARSALRAREIGVRKAVGAERKEIILQFLGESVLVAWCAFILAVVLTALVLPGLNKLSGQELSMHMLLSWKVVAPILLVPFVAGIFSGLYPALFMSSFQPAKVLKGLLKVGGGNISFRKALVISQFAISIVLIISTALVFQQLRYMQTKSLGFDKNHIVTVLYNSALNDKFEAFRTELLTDASIKNVSRSSRIPSGRLLDAMDTKIKSGDTLEPMQVDIKYLNTDYDFLSTYGVKVLAGRAFSRDFGADTSSFIVNEAAVKILGIKSNNDAIGKYIVYGGIQGNIVGVVNDFHFESMHQKILPLVMLKPTSANYGRLSFKIAGNNLDKSLADIKKVWQTFLPETPYDYTFLDDKFGQLYKTEQIQGTIFTIFACIAIFIACLGLFGLSSFTITQRIKEIGIRKVLGASAGTIVTLLSKDFLKLVIVAAVIAFPIAWYAMSAWLQDFAYRIDIPWWIFVVAGVAAALIALVTISFQAIKAATGNPVKNLRTE
jgi:putative ABC transport system permease protein